jgi:hypothetical protein
MAQAGSHRSTPLPKSHGTPAEEILVKVEQHGFRPLQQSRMMVRVESVLFHEETPEKGKERIEVVPRKACLSSSKWTKGVLF